MNTCKYALLILLQGVVLSAWAQTVRAKSNTLAVDLSEGEASRNSTYPRINWIQPMQETVFQRNEDTGLDLVVTSSRPIREVTLTLVSRNDNTQQRLSSKKIVPKENEKLEMQIGQHLNLPEGINEVEIAVENIDGLRSYSYRYFHVGETALADASRLSRNDYALIITTDNYDHWPQLVNPVFDGRAIAKELESTFGFKTEVMENPTQDQIWSRLREYAERKYQPLDQLFIFIAGHGHYDNTFKEGYLVTKESLPNDPGFTSYISHNRLRSNVNSIPCDHIFLMMDACFSGTFDEAIASARSLDDVYKEVSQSEFIVRKLAYKTRKYLTSGGKEYVSDGVKGHHSPFASKFLDALATKGKDDGILSLNELLSNVEKIVPEPKFGKFGDDAPGSEFVFIVKQ